MFENTRSKAVLLARVGAVAFALSACGYLVVTAQRRANPKPAVTPVIVEHVTTTTQPTQSELFLQGSKSLVLEASEIVEAPDAAPAEGHFGETVFLSSSKTLNWPAPPNPPPLVFPPIPAATEPVQATGTEFLPSSKVGVIATPERVFLPSSKVKTQLNPLRPQTLVPGTTSTTERVFLPSSKSLRIGESKPPAPTAPPKNP